MLQPKALLLFSFLSLSACKHQSHAHAENNGPALSNSAASPYLTLDDGLSVIKENNSEQLSIVQTEVIPATQLQIPPLVLKIFPHSLLVHWKLKMSLNTYYQARICFQTTCMERLGVGHFLELSAFNPAFAGQKVNVSIRLCEGPPHNPSCSPPETIDADLAKISFPADNEKKLAAEEQRQQDILLGASFFPQLEQYYAET